MRKIGSLLVVAAALALSIASGSSVEHVKNKGALEQADPYAPVNEGKGGTVKYFVTAFNSKTNANRREAYKAMHDACGGDFRIVEERQVKETLLGQEQDWVHVDYECVAKSMVPPT